MSSLVAGIITYQPEVGTVLAALQSLSGEAVTLFVVDNASDNASELERALSHRSDVSLLRQDRNLGLAAAINLLIREADKLQADFFMVVDQDSVLERGHAAQMMHNFQSLQGQHPGLGALGAHIYDCHRGRFNPFKTFRFPWQSRPPAAPTGYHRADFLITSGTLISTQCLQDVGQMNESLFIDSVDMDWCFRATYRNWQLLGCDSPIIEQRIGSGTLHDSGPFAGIRVHDAQRYYTMTRNRRFLHGQPYTSRAWKLKDTARATLKLLLLLVLSTRRRAIWKAHWQGYQAGQPDVFPPRKEQ
jgi:rhamnosyltransferase